MSEAHGSPEETLLRVDSIFTPAITPYHPGVWPIDDTTVAELARQCRHYNAFPVYLPRYFYDSTPHPLGRLLHPIVRDVAAYIALMSDSEYTAFLDTLPPWTRFFLDRHPERGLADQRERIALWCVAGAIQERYVSVRDVLDANLESSDVIRTYPELATAFDDEGLLRIDERFKLFDGGIEYRDHILHYHQFLRRGFGSNPNFDFLGRFARAYRETHGANTFRIAIDHHRLMPRDWYARMVEADAWFGPPFDPAKLDDHDAVGLTVVARNPNSLFRLSNALERTEFFWSYRDGIKTFECEEVSTQEIQRYYLNRYAHAQRDIGRHEFIHLDGAVKVYLEDVYSERRGTYMPREPKCFRKPKLWRVDGTIALDTWVELLCFFFRQNEMVIEYLNPTAFEEGFELRVRDFEKWKADQPNT